MTNALKSIVGTGGFDKCVVEAADAALKSEFQESGNDWIAAQSQDIGDTWNSRSSDRLGLYNLIKLANDLEFLAAGIDKHELSMVAESLGVFADKSLSTGGDKVVSESAAQLVELHINAIHALTSLIFVSAEDQELAKRVVEDLRVAVAKVSGV